MSETKVASQLSSAISAQRCRRAIGCADRAHCRPLRVEPCEMPRLGRQDDILKMERPTTEITTHLGGMRKVSERVCGETEDREAPNAAKRNSCLGRVVPDCWQFLQHANFYLTSRVGAHCPTNVQQSIEHVKQTFADVTPQDRTDLFDGSLPESRSKPSRLATAFLRERELANWVQGVNLVQRIAPLTAVVLKNALKLGCMPRESTAATHKSRKQWLPRLRERWGAAMGRIAPREHVPADVMHAKAF